MMRKCWRKDPEERPTFSELVAIVEKQLVSLSSYTEFSMVLENVNSQDQEQLSEFCHGDPLINSVWLFLTHRVSIFAK